MLLFVFDFLLINIIHDPVACACKFGKNRKEPKSQSSAS